MAVVHLLQLGDVVSDGQINLRNQRRECERRRGLSSHSRTCLLGKHPCVAVFVAVVPLRVWKDKFLHQPLHGTNVVSAQLASNVLRLCHTLRCTKGLAGWSLWSTLFTYHEGFQKLEPAERTIRVASKVSLAVGLCVGSNEHAIQVLRPAPRILDSVSPAASWVCSTHHNTACAVVGNFAIQHKLREVAPLYGERRLDIVEGSIALEDGNDGRVQAFHVPLHLAQYVRLLHDARNLAQMVPSRRRTALLWCVL